MSIYEEIRKNYPHPVSANQTSLEPRAYCVGGALCQYLSSHNVIPLRTSFPDSDELTLALQAANSALSWQDARNVAEEIIGLNEEHNFDLAWATLERALEWPKCRILFNT